MTSASGKSSQSGGELLEHWDPTDGSDITYGYDGAGQLTSESGNGYSWYSVGAYLLTYTYDHNGNRLTKGLTNGGGSYSDAYAYQPDYYASSLHTDELVSVQGGVTGNRVFTYDANGDLRSANANGYLLFLTPDYEDRYTRFDFDTGPGRGSAYATETYNGLGARFARRSADGHTHGMALDGVSPGAALLYDSDGGMLFTPGIAQTTNGVSLYTNVDALGSVHDTQTDGDYPRDQVRFEAFGGAVLRNCSDPLPLGFAGAAGYQTDADTGLMLLGNRYYDASVGRFITPDHAKAGDNWYAYCDNDPLGYIDPEGLFATGMSAPTGANCGNPGAQFDSAATASNRLGHEDDYVFHFHDTVTTNTRTGAFISDSGPVLDWVDGPSDQYSNYFQNVDYIFSVGVSGSLGLGTHRYSGSAGIAINLNTREIEGTASIGHYHGVALGASLAPYVGLGSGNWSGFNGLSSSYGFALPEGGAEYDFNPNYHGFQFSLPGLGGEAGAYMGVPDGPTSTRGGSYTFNTAPSTSYLYGPIL